jgi:uncharacterized protein YjbK
MDIKKNTKKLVSFRMDMNLHRELKTLLASKEVSLQDWLNRTIIEALNTVKKGKNLKGGLIMYDPDEFYSAEDYRKERFDGYKDINHIRDVTKKIYECVWINLSKPTI